MKALEDIDITDICRVSEGNDNRIAIPARYWMDGWKLRYVVSTNGSPTAPVGPDPDDPMQDITVHNYHRMKDVEAEELQLVEGARVYIEDEEDFEKFIHYLDEALVKTEPDTSDGKQMWEDEAYMEAGHRGYIGAKRLPKTYDPYVLIYPNFARNVHFVLKNDIDMDAAGIGEHSHATIFGGYFSGMGHTVKLANCKQFMANTTNSSRFYFAGFYSSRSDVKLFNENHGRMVGCFYYNDNPAGPAPLGASDADAFNHRGMVMPFDAFQAEDSQIEYCYQNAVEGAMDNFGNPTYFPDDQFMYGRVGYNLNVFYLNERYKHHTGKAGKVNVNYNLYVPNFYFDGCYRYADYDKALVPVGLPTALRTADKPNYKDPLGRGHIPASAQLAITGVEAREYGLKATFHNCADVFAPETVRDVLRYAPQDTIVKSDGNGGTVEEIVPEHYEALYPLDYIFFGQDLSAADTYQRYPTAVTPDTRIYRASGFYGTKEDKAFMFNRACVARYPSLTAIDFTGRRTVERMAYIIDNDPPAPNNSLWVTAQYSWGYDGDPVNMQSLFFPPVLDLPVNHPDSLALLAGTTDPDHLGLLSFRTIGNSTIEAWDKVTKNLLVYVSNEAVGSVFSNFSYGTDTEQGDISAHIIRGYPGTPFSLDDRLKDLNIYEYKANGGLLHLVDKQDFNAPISFDVFDRAWYDRMPQKYSSGNNAWEGLSLPFTVHSVTAKAAVDNGYAHIDRGKLTHFYGTLGQSNIKDAEVTEIEDSHEYWLRKFTGIKTAKTPAEKDTAIFHRPVDEQDIAAGNAQETKIEEYHYANDFFSRAYGTRDYNIATSDGHNHVLPQYTPAGVDYKDYPMITAGHPYIVTYPGPRYYEFDLSGVFFRDKVTEDKASAPIPQLITYETAVADYGDVVEIPVTDDVDPICFDHDGYHCDGTFFHIEPSADYLLPEDDGLQANRMIYPFRIYLTPIGGAGAPPFIAIGTSGLSDFGDDRQEDDEKDNAPVNLTVYVEDGNLVVISDRELLLLPLYGITGQLYSRLTVHAGTNVYRGLNSGVYIVNGKKFAIKR